MPFDYARIADPRYVCDNRGPAHCDHRWFADAAEAASGVSRFERCLNGLWKFHYAKNPAAVLPGFERLDFDCSDWDDIPVPAHIQLQGYDRPQYVNVQYPWDGWEAIEPGQVPTRFNPVATYVTDFTWDQPLAPGERLTVVFHGAESGVAVWLNGRYIGYATDSFTPSEFDLTPVVVTGSNKLAVQVFKWTAGSWLEDQDMFRFSGLFRDVMLYRKPACHADDMRITTTVGDDLATAEITLAVDLSAPGRVSAELVGVGRLGEDGARLSLRLDAPHLWSDEDPFLYDLLIEVHDAAGRLSEVIPWRVGFRRCGIEDGLIKINGRRLVFKGVNRHEFGLAGRVMSREQTEADIRLLKAIGVNALRTCHYPNNSFLYDLCDQYGLYVIDEMNLETHALWDRLRLEGLGDSQALPGDRPEWLPALLDRAASLLRRDKNHASVVIWSCGNESYGGADILAVSNYFRAEDPTRPVHYEGVWWDPRYPETTDIVSRMYTPAAEIEDWLATHRDKPHILCEYAHAMGNSFGAVDKYLDLAEREPLFQGGFIWDFADQAISLRDRYGQAYFGYGGDCDDRPNDADFCGDGIVFADHSPSPKVAEVRHLYQGFRIDLGPEKIVVANRYLFTDSSQFDCRAELACQGTVLAAAPLATAIAPGERASFAWPFALPTEPGEYCLGLSFHLRQATAWAPAGYEIAWQQMVYAVPGPTPARPPGRPELVEGIHNIGLRADHAAVLFSRQQGGPVSYRWGASGDGGRELLRAVPRPNFWHAPTSNERGWQMPARDGQWLLASLYSTLRPGPDGGMAVVEVGADTTTVSYRYDLPTSPAGDCQVSYGVGRDGLVEVELVVHPGAGLPDMPEFGLMLMLDASLHHLTWYGDGPRECYVDRRGGARLGVYRGDVADQLTRYLRPQEAGNHTRVRWATLTDDHGFGLRFDCPAGMDFSALPWTPFQIEQAAHHTELPAPAYTVVRPAWMRRGVGGDNSWGAPTHPEYCLPADQELRFSFSFRGLWPGGAELSPR